MLNSRDAREMTIGNASNEVLEELKLIESLIETAVLQGKFHVQPDTIISEITVEMLKDLGYNIHRVGSVDVELYEISWLF